MRGTRELIYVCVLAGGVLAAACAGGPAVTSTPISAPTVMPTSVPTPTPSAALTTAPTAPPTVEPTAAAATPPPPTAPPTPEPTQAPEPTPDPAAAQALLTSYVHPDLQSTCVVREPVYEGEFAEVVSITCGPEDLPFDLSLFGSAAAMQGAYNADVADAETPPVTGGLCTEGVFEGVYGAENAPLGRLNCRWHTSSSTGEMYRVLEWTNDELNVIGYISNREDVHSWEELIAFRATQAGPFPAE